MSKFLSDRLSSLEAYVPGEQPRDMKYIKLNTNESPYPPSDSVASALGADEIQALRLYPDPTGAALKDALAEHYGVSRENVFLSNGSDETLSFIFMAFCDKSHPVAFPDITYGFYRVYGDLYGVPYTELPLKDDFSVNITDYIGRGENIILANPNAPTGIALSLKDIEHIVSSNSDNLVVIDEAYVDFGAESAVSLTKKYDNLLVVMTYSKSRSMAGARLGFAIGNSSIISDLEKIKFSTNPYNINRLTLTAGEAALRDSLYYLHNCNKIIDTRKRTIIELKKLGFDLTDSLANFLFVCHPDHSGEELYLALKSRGILVRHFNGERIMDYLRITIGNDMEMDALIAALKDIVSK